MKFILFILIVVAIGSVVWWSSKNGIIQLVTHAKLLFKTWSVWLASAGSAMGAWVQSFPDSASSAWNGLPEDVKTVIPQHFLGFLASFMVAMAVIAQFIRQKKLAAEKEQLSAAPTAEIRPIRVPFATALTAVTAPAMASGSVIPEILSMPMAAGAGSSSPMMSVVTSEQTPEPGRPAMSETTTPPDATMMPDPAAAESDATPAAPVSTPVAPEVSVVTSEQTAVPGRPAMSETTTPPEPPPTGSDATPAAPVSTSVAPEVSVVTSEQTPEPGRPATSETTTPPDATMTPDPAAAESDATPAAPVSTPVAPEVSVVTSEQTAVPGRPAMSETTTPPEPPPTGSDATPAAPVST
ncbi:hypothetical protein, partial [Erwinia sp. 198]|uniref:DUF7940 domain-containing protein n=1 Tax=Erwinia sp. 198 TaxID=2022746 RepID=UPI003518BCD7